MKKLLLSLVIAITAVAMSAQALVSEQPRFGHKFAPLTLSQPVAMFKMPSLKALAPNQLYMGPYTSDAVANAENGLGLPGYPQTFKMGALLPISLVKNFEGGTIKAIRFGVTVAIDDAAVFLIPVTSLSPLKLGAPVIEQTVESTVAGWNLVELNDPYIINTDGAVAYLLGYQYLQKNTQKSGYYTDECYPISAVDEGEILPTYTYGKLGSSTATWTDIGLSDYGNLSVQAIVENDNFKEYNLMLNKLQCEPFGSADKGLNYSISLTNVGTATAVTDYKLEMLVDGNVIETLVGPATVTQTATEYSGKLALTDITSGPHTVTARLIEVAGNAIEAQELSADFSSFLSSFPRKKQLIEHLTSQSCTYCPLGVKVLTALDELRDDLAWVSIHGVQLSQYQHVFVTDKSKSLLNYLGCHSFPTAVLNRYDYGFTGELPRGIGYYEQYSQAAAQMLSAEIDANPTPSLATVDINATINNDTRQLTVTISGEATQDFGIIFGTDVALNVYLTEDNLVARQLNNGTWETNAVHNHVLRDVLSTTPAGDAINWNNDNTYSRTYTTTLDEAWDMEQMHIVAFIARTGSGVNKEVINTDLFDVKDAQQEAQFEHVYVLGEVNENSWAPNVGLEMNTEDGIEYTVDVKCDGRNNHYNYFSFTTRLAEDADDWGGMAAYRFGAVTENNSDFLVTDEMLNKDLALQAGEAAFQIPAGRYNLLVNLDNMTLNITRLPIIGDVNADGIVDVEDVNAVINIALGFNKPGDFKGKADLNEDGLFDVEDVNMIINIILSNN